MLINRIEQPKVNLKKNLFNKKEPLQYTIHG